MKKLIYYILAIIIITIILPAFIVKSCSFTVISQSQGQVDTGIDLNSNKISLEDKTGHNSQRDKNSSDFENISSIYFGDIRVKVLFDEDKIVRELDLEEYITGVVAAEMPAEFAVEALKAQAVAARTFTYGRLKGLYKGKDDAHSSADVCTNFAHCQAWVSKEDAFKKWPDSEAEKLWNKIEGAVKDTEGQIIVYNGTIANPVFHSTSGGKTENAEDVWDVNPVDYLKSVVSEGEETSPSFKTVTTLTANEFCKILKSHYPNIQLNENNIFSDIKVLDYTEGDRVKTIKIGNVTLKGTDVRNVFSLKSASFELEKDSSGMVKITTYGYGHGVGMSQWGANSMAKNGAVWEEIIKHYYVGVDIDTIENVEYIFSVKTE